MFTSILEDTSVICVVSAIVMLQDGLLVNHMKAQCECKIFSEKVCRIQSCVEKKHLAAVARQRLLQILDLARLSGKLMCAVQFASSTG